MIPKGWIANDDSNYSTVVHPSGTFAIAVAGGDAFTGRNDRIPSTRSEKGEATRYAIRGNQLSFGDLDPAFPWPRAPRAQLTWLLMYYRDERTHEIRLELSLPAGMSGDAEQAEPGFVTSWRERLILRAVPLGPISDGPGNDNDDDTPINVPVTRR